MARAILTARLITPGEGTDKAPAVPGLGIVDPGGTAQQQGGTGHYGGTAGTAL